MRNQSLRALLMSASFIPLPLAATGQEVRSDTADTVTLDPIYLTARKRPEVDLKVPLSTTVLSAEQTSATTLDPGTDIARRAPNLNVTDMARPGDRFGTMRGVGPLGTPLNSLDSTVGYAIGGVATSAFAYGQPLFDIDRIEVLRGPQGTLFGRNALGGLINVVPHGADGEREFRLGTQVGTNGYRQLDGVAAGWLVPEQLAGRAAFLIQRFDGDVPNKIIGGKDGGVALGAGRLSLRYTPDDTLTVDATASFSRDDRNNVVWVLKEMPGYPVSGSDIRPENNRDIGQFTLEVNKDFGALRFTSVTSYQTLDIFSRDDFTDSFIFGKLLRVPSGSLIDPTTNVGSVRDREKLFSQEFRLSSSEGAAVEWVGGLSYFRSDFNTLRVMNNFMWPTLNGTTDNDIRSETIALFGDATVPLSDRWTLSGGLRIARDTQQLDGRFRTNGSTAVVPALDQSGRYSDSYTTGRVALSYAWNDDTESYVSVARGYASGGFERTTQNAAKGVRATPFAPSRSLTVEAGTKARLPSGVELAGALFYNDVKDGQLSGFDNATAQVFFANQDYQSYGAELQAAGEIAPGLNLTAGLGYTRSKMTGATRPALPQSVAGNQVPQTPVWTGTLGLDYVADAPVGMGGEVRAGIDFQYLGSRYPDIQNTIKMKPARMVNLHLGWERDGFALNAFVDNALDERITAYSTSYGPGVTADIVGRGRVAGIGASWTW